MCHLRLTLQVDLDIQIESRYLSIHICIYSPLTNTNTDMNISWMLNFVSLTSSDMKMDLDRYLSDPLSPLLVWVNFCSVAFCYSCFISIITIPLSPIDGVMQLSYLPLIVVHDIHASFIERYQSYSKIDIFSNKSYSGTLR